MSRFLLRRFPHSTFLRLSSSSKAHKASFQFSLSPTISPTTTISSINNSFSFFRNFSSASSFHLVMSDGKPMFQTRQIDPPSKYKWITKKKLKLRRKKDKLKKKLANKKNPRHLGIKGNKKNQRFANAEEGIIEKLRRAKIKEAMLIERLKRYDVVKQQSAVVKPADLTGEERFYMKKMAQKRSNYAPIGRRGIFGGVILNMHLHWKKHETVKVICKPCKPGQAQDYAEEIARLSGGTPIHIIGDDTLIFYRGKNYVQPQVMSPIDTLSKKRALEKSKYEQSLESVRQFMAIAEKELELYHRHVALYRDWNERNPLDRPTHEYKESVQFDMLDKKKCKSTTISLFSNVFTETEDDCTYQEVLEAEDEFGRRERDCDNEEKEER